MPSRVELVKPEGVTVRGVTGGLQGRSGGKVMFPPRAAAAGCGRALRAGAAAEEVRARVPPAGARRRGENQAASRSDGTTGTGADAAAARAADRDRAAGPAPRIAAAPPRGRWAKARPPPATVSATFFSTGSCQLFPARPRPGRRPVIWSRTPAEPYSKIHRRLPAAPRRAGKGQTRRLQSV